MTVDRPTVSAELFAGLVETTPDRVRRRLDKTPDAAAGWDWNVDDFGWSIIAGEETVKLPKEIVSSLEQVSCTCLLSPTCFHVLACLTRLEVIAIVSEESDETEAIGIESPTDDSDDDVVELSDKQRRASGELISKLDQLLNVGVAQAGVVVQSGLIRAVHQCRAEGLHRLASLGLRVVAGTREFRTRAATSDTWQLAEDMADLLETSRHVAREKTVASFWIGTARRKQLPIRTRKLFGLFAEPIVTRSGFSGAAVYFLGDDDRIYTASDVRPGDAQRVRDAYLGGIEIGSMIQPAKKLARSSYIGADLTASQDRRLGRGTAIKIAEQGPSTWQIDAIQKRFQSSLLDQWNAVYSQAELPADARPAGWDFVFLIGTVVIAMGAELIFQARAISSSGNPKPPAISNSSLTDGATNSEGTVTIRLTIENESESLCFRDNLRMLSQVPGLPLFVIGRVNLQDPRIVSPLAIANLPCESQTDNPPRLELPESFADRVCLGFDEIQSQYLGNRRNETVVLGTLFSQADKDDPLSSLRRRWIAAMLSGRVSQLSSHARNLAREISLLKSRGYQTGAALMDALSHAEADGGPTITDTFLASAIYMRACELKLSKSLMVEETFSMSNI